MVAIGSILVAFIATVVGLIHSHSATEGDHLIFGFTKIGVLLLSLAAIALIFGITKEVQNIQASEAIKLKEEQRDELLKQIYSQVSGVKSTVQNEEAIKDLDVILDRVSKAASLARESDFSMSDFSRSNFRSGKFTQANFENALFDGANFQGADLSKAVIDATTKLPE